MSVRRFLAPLLVSFLLAGCGPSAEEKQQAEQAAQRERDQAARDAAQAAALKESLKQLADFPAAGVRASIVRAQTELRGTAGFAALEGDLARLLASLDSVDAIQAAAKEARAADILTAALAGFTATEPIMTARNAKAEESMEKFRKLLMDPNSSTVAMDSVNRDLTVQSSMFQLAGGPFAYFVLAMGTIANNGPADVRRATFDAAAAAVAPATFGRTSLESVMRACYEKEDDEATKKRFATKMAELNVPLVAPKTETAPAAQ